MYLKICVFILILGITQTATAKICMYDEKELSVTRTMLQNDTSVLEYFREHKAIITRVASEVCFGIFLIPQADPEKDVIPLPPTMFEIDLNIIHTVAKTAVSHEINWFKVFGASIVVLHQLEEEEERRQDQIRKELEYTVSV